MKIVVDTNIIFSAILNINSNIGKLLSYPDHRFDFYSCEFLKFELLNHKSKIIKITKYSPAEFDELEYLVTKNISFLNHNLVGSKAINNATEQLKNIDTNDVPFYVLAKHLKAKIWTGYKVLIKGLNKIGFQNTITTSELINYNT